MLIFQLVIYCWLPSCVETSFGRPLPPCWHFVHLVHWSVIREDIAAYRNIKSANKKSVAAFTQVRKWQTIMCLVETSLRSKVRNHFKVFENAWMMIYYSTIFLLPVYFISVKLLHTLWFYFLLIHIWKSGLWLFSILLLLFQLNLFTFAFIFSNLKLFFPPFYAPLNF